VGQRLHIWLKPSAIKKDSVTQTMPIPLPVDKTYVVQEGDTLWSISKKFEGLSIEKIKALNNLNSNSIQPGQKLVIGK
jgi:membrane-bound lytic murein transglycosylase D